MRARLACRMSSRPPSPFDVRATFSINERMSSLTSSRHSPSCGSQQHDLFTLLPNILGQAAQLTSNRRGMEPSGAFQEQRDDMFGILDQFDRSLVGRAVFNIPQVLPEPFQSSSARIKPSRADG